MNEREHGVRQHLLAAYDKLVPGIVGNPYVPHWPTPPQARFLGLHRSTSLRDSDTLEALYGGAAGGGKSDAILISSVQYVHVPGFAAVCVRRSYAELSQPGALMDRAMKWWLPLGVRWDGTNKIFSFPSGARVKMAYHGNPKDDLQFQGAEFQQASWDELTHWPDPSAYLWVSFSRMRKPVGMPAPIRSLSTSNPGGPGHTWVAERFVTGTTDPETGIHSPPIGLYVPARVSDNPHIDREAYTRSLSRLHPVTRQRMLDGDWTAREPGDYFRAEWFGPLLPADTVLPPNETISIRWWDLAASEKEGAARTAGVLMSRLRSGVRVIRHAVAFRATPGSRDATIVRQAKMDGHEVIVGIEIEGGSGGVAQFDSLASTLRSEGFRVVGARPRVMQSTTEAEDRLLVTNPTALHGKEGRADPVAACVERGFQRRGEADNTAGVAWWGIDAGRPLAEQRDGIRIIVGPWTRAYLEEIEGFPDGKLLDLVDATSGAWAWLEAHPFGLRTARHVEQKEPPADRPDVHPEDRPEPEPRRWEPP